MFRGKCLGFNYLKTIGNAHALGMIFDGFLGDEPIIGIQDPSFSCAPATLDGASLVRLCSSHLLRKNMTIHTPVN